MHFLPVISINIVGDKSLVVVFIFPSDMWSIIGNIQNPVVTLKDISNVFTSFLENHLC